MSVFSIENQYDPQQIEKQVQEYWDNNNVFAAEQDDSKEKFVNDFVKAWVKVMDADRFDLK